MANAGAPVDGEGGQIDTGLGVGALLGGTIAALGYGLGITAMGPLGLAAVIAATAIGFFVGFNYGSTKAGELSPDLVLSDLDLNSCFARGTLIELPHGLKPIENIVPGDVVMAFDGFGDLSPRKVVRLFRNVTDRWLELSFEASSQASLIVTPGHRFLTADGRFETIERLLERGSGQATIVLAGNSLHVSGPGGSDTLTNVETLAFDNVTVPARPAMASP